MIETMEAKEAERALGVLLTALIDHDLRRAAENRNKPAALQVISVEDLMERTDAELELIELVRDPIRRSLQSGVRGFGKQLFRLLGSTDAMRDALERVADMDPQRYTYRAVIMDHAWNGIGSDTDRWWA